MDLNSCLLGCQVCASNQEAHGEIEGQNVKRMGERACLGPK